MKFIHLSDLHIAKRVNDVPMTDDQRYILTQILDVIDSESPDAVLIAGDVYDRSVPPTEGVSLLDDFLSSISQRHIPVMLIAGNHDSVERLAFGHRLMNNAQVYISPVYDENVKHIILQDEYGEVCFWLLPFVKPVHVRLKYPDEQIDTYTDAIRVAIEHMDLNKTKRNVLLAHQFVTGARTCDSEEISVGGVDNVDAEVFQAFDYVALGHIHSPQNVMSGKIRYCGTPLKYSFSEANSHKSVTVVTLKEKGECEIREVPLTPRHDLREIRGTFSQVTDREFLNAQACDDYLHITLTDEEDVPEAMGKLQQIYPNLLQLSYDNTRTRTNRVLDKAAEMHKSPLELFDDLYEMQNNRKMSDEQRTYIQQLVEEIWEDKP